MYALCEDPLEVTFSLLQERMGTKEYMPMGSKTTSDYARPTPELNKTKRQLSIFIPSDHVVDVLFRAIAHFSSFQDTETKQSILKWFGF
jgi:hypothetical protein